MRIEDFTIYQKGVVSIRAPHVNLGYINVNKLFKKYPGTFYIRYYSDFDSALTKNFYFVVKDGEFSMETIPSKTRNMVRRCLKNCLVCKTDVETIVNKGGYGVYLSEMNRFNKKGFSTHVNSFDKWEKGMRNADKSGQEFWGVFYNNNIAAYGVTSVKDQVVNLVTWKCNYAEYNSLYPSYGLIYRMTEYYLNQPGIKYLNDGNRSFTEHSKVQELLINKFGYRKAYTKLHVYFKWWLKLIILILLPFEKIIRNNIVLSLIKMYKWSK